MVKQIYLGSLERLAALAQGTSGKGQKIAVQEFGALLIANLIEAQVGVATIIDVVLPRVEQERGPSLGEYFLYAVFNRMVDSCSKRALPEWFQATAIKQIRPVGTEKLTSQRYWDKWDRVEPEDLKQIAARFFQKVGQLEKLDGDCFLFDTTNYYTYMAGDTPSELAQPGQNKDGKHWLRQVGVTLLVDRDPQIPLFYREYQGNRHDSKEFQRILGKITAVMKLAASADRELTIIFDKGMNSSANIALIDTTPKVHFITTYSSYYAEGLIRVKLSRFTPVDTLKNRQLDQLGRTEDRLVAYRTSGEYWGQARTVVVTYNPRTATKQRLAFEKKLFRLQETLFELRTKVRTQKAHWTDADCIAQHYAEACERLHLPQNLYEVSLEEYKHKKHLLFRKNYYRIGLSLERLGKNILISDLADWSTDQIVQASLDRYTVEKAFRQSKDHDLVSLYPLRHWTDSKIRCHIFTCVVALTYLRLIENRLRQAGLPISAATAMENMRRLHSCLCWTASKRGAERMIEDPTPMQAQILAAFGYQVASGVLQNLDV
ncbi:MAG: IS1634 family transposase [Desulfobacteraceae bacterium]